ncbi:MAG: molybdenum cofactor biosynthesis protein MoaE [Thermodesulfobacteriota bacterium]|nr:molybdenum cofactor biosynthesis protein MoaE [Thermodesulfobacteriota bacterium]
MDLNKMTESIKSRSTFHQSGMIATHLGIVRSFSRDGNPVTAFDLSVNMKKIQEIMKDIRSRPGIIEILIETNEGHLEVGDEIVAIMVAGDTRDHVFPALTDAISRFKSEAATEKEV